MKKKVLCATMGSTKIVITNIQKQAENRVYAHLVSVMRNGIEKGLDTENILSMVMYEMLNGMMENYDTLVKINNAMSMRGKMFNEKKMLDEIEKITEESVQSIDFFKKMRRSTTDYISSITKAIKTNKK